MLWHFLPFTYNSCILLHLFTVEMGWWTQWLAHKHTDGGMGGEVLARYRWEPYSIANLNSLSLWCQSSCRTHSLSHSVWSFPDTRPGLFLWTMSPAHSHNTPLAGRTQKAQTKHPMLVCEKDKCKLHAEHYLIMRHHGVLFWSREHSLSGRSYIHVWFPDIEVHASPLLLTCHLPVNQKCHLGWTTRKICDTSDMCCDLPFIHIKAC